MQKWKQVNGSAATYRNLIGVFEKVGYKGYAETVCNIISPGEYELLQLRFNHGNKLCYSLSHAVGPNAASSSPEGAHVGGVTSPVQVVKVVAGSGSCDALVYSFPIKIIY